MSTLTETTERCNREVELGQIRVRHAFELNLLESQRLQAEIERRRSRNGKVEPRRAAGG